MPPWRHVSWASAQLTWWVYDAWVYLSEVFDADLAIYLANVAGEPLLLSTATFHCHLPLPPSTATFHWSFSLALFARSVQPTRATSTGTSSGSGPPRSGRSVRRCGTKEMINPVPRPAGVSSLWSRRCRACPARSPGPIRPWPACTVRSPTLVIGGSFSRLAHSLFAFDLLLHMLAMSASCPVLRPPAATKHKATRRGRPV